MAQALSDVGFRVVSAEDLSSLPQEPGKDAHTQGGSDAEAIFVLSATADAHALTRLSERVAGSKAVMLWDDIDATVAAALDTGRDAKDAIDRWASAADATLAFYRGNRNRVTLVASDDLDAQPGTIVGLLASDLSTPADTADWKLASQLIDRHHLSRLLAREWTAGSERLRALCAELDASSIGRPESGESSLRELALQELRALRKKTIDLEQARADLAAQHEAKLEHMNDDLEALRGQYDRLVAEKATLAEQLFLTQEDLEHYYMEREELAQRRDELETRIEEREAALLQAERRADSLEHQVTALRRSLSWRFTSPIRALLKPFER